MISDECVGAVVADAIRKAVAQDVPHDAAHGRVQDVLQGVARGDVGGIISREGGWVGCFGTSHAPAGVTAGGRAV